MKRIILFYILIFFTIPLIAQHKNIVFGISFQPYRFKYYNRHEWTQSPISYPKTSYGKALGTYTRIGMTKYLGVESYLLFSSEIQRHISSNYSIQLSEDNVRYIHNILVLSSFKRTRLKIGFNTEMEIGHGSGIFVEFALGTQISLLNKFENSYKVYYVDSTLNVNFDLLRTDVIVSSDNSYQKWWDNPINQEDFTYTEFKFIDKEFYKRFNIGGYTEFVAVKEFSNKYFIKVAIFGDFDFTRTNGKDFFSDIWGGTITESDKWLNIRYGLNFSLLYKFNYYK